MKFKIPEDYNNLTLREIFQTLKVPKKDSAEYVKRNYD